MLHLIYTEKTSTKNADGSPQFQNISYDSGEDVFSSLTDFLVSPIRAHFFICLSGAGL